MKWIKQLFCEHDYQYPEDVNIHNPNYWTLSWSCDVELGFPDGNYLPRRAAQILHPKYFDDLGNPKLDMLPMDDGTFCIKKTCLRCGKLSKY